MFYVSMKTERTGNSNWFCCYLSAAFGQKEVDGFCAVFFLKKFLNISEFI